MSFSSLSDAGFIIQLHVFAAVLALLIGPFALLRKRRDRIHKTVGYIWVSAMAITALSSFLIFELRVIGLFSPIHLLSVLALVSMGFAINRIRQKDVVGHKRAMWRLYYQAIGLAGLFTFLPGRTMNETFTFAEPWSVFAVAVCVFGAGCMAIYVPLRSSLKS
jgi:uncharacterized membrane protein